MKIKILSVIVMVLVCSVGFTCAYVPVLADTSGVYGDNITWSFSDGVLTFSGYGEMSGAWNETHFYEKGLDIKKAIIEEGITSVSSMTFAFLKSLEEVALPSTLTSIGFSAFSYCENLRQIDLPKGLMVIEERAFESSGISELIIPEGVSYIPSNAFEYCRGLKSVKFEGNISRIDDAAFQSCHLLSSVEFLGTVEEFGDFSFAYCLKLDHFDVPEGTKTIGNYAFYNCPINATIPASVNYIGEKCFDHLSRYSVSSDSEFYHSINDACLVNKKTNELMLAKTLSRGKTDYVPETLTIPDGVEIISPDAIGASEQYICVLPSSVKEIGANNFLPYNFWKVIYNGDDFSSIKISSSGNEGLLDCIILNAAGETIQNPVFERSYSFISNGGTPVEDIYADKIEVAPTTTRLGFDFVAWSTDPETSPGNEITFPYDGGETVFYAVWKKTTKRLVCLQIDNYLARINGKNEELDAAPKIVNSRTMLPIRAVAEGLGADVQWDDEEQRVVIFGEENTIIIYIGKDQAYVNNVPVKLETVPFIENSRTYLPLRFVCETLGAEVEWLPDTREIIITAEGDE